MAKPDAQKSKDIEVSNRIMAFIRPYLIIEEPVSHFVIERALGQAFEIKDITIRFSTLSMVYFSSYETQRAIDYAEQAIAWDPNDSVSWKHYMLGMFWRCGPVEALEIVHRARKYIRSWEMMRNGLFYALDTADYASALQLYSDLVKAEKLDDLVHEDKEKNVLDKALEYAQLAEEHEKTDAVRALSQIMMQQLDWQQKQRMSARLLDVSDEDGPSLLLEMFVVDSDSVECSDMNIDLISHRAASGLIDWDLGGVFVSCKKDDVLNASKAFRFS